MHITNEARIPIEFHTAGSNTLIQAPPDVIERVRTWFENDGNDVVSSNSHRNSTCTTVAPQSSLGDDLSDLDCYSGQEDNAPSESDPAGMDFLESRQRVEEMSSKFIGKCSWSARGLYKRNRPSVPTLHGRRNMEGAQKKSDGVTRRRENRRSTPY